MSRKRPLRGLSTFLHFLALLLTILSFSFAIAALTSKSWVSKAQYAGSDDDPNTTEILVGHYTRGPLGQCTLISPSDGDDDVNPWPWACVGGKMCVLEDPYDDSEWFCQQIQVWSGALIAGVVFTGLGMVGIVVGWVLQSRGRGEDGTKKSGRRAARDRIFTSSIINNFITTFLILGIMTTGIASLEMLELLVNNQKADSDFISGSGAYWDTRHWVWKRPGAVFAVLGWLPSIAALVVFLPLGLMEREWSRVSLRHDGREEVVPAEENGDGDLGQDREVK